MKEWTDYIAELQSIAQAGLYYGKDRFDLERYQRLREISAELLSLYSGIPEKQITPLFCGEVGYQTPKLDTRAAVFEDDRILLVQESGGLWTLPGGWVDFDLSPTESAVKEVREEAGLEVRADRLIAVQDREKHNEPRYLYKICKLFYLCTRLGGSFRPNSETTDSGYFSPEELPELDIAKTSEEQIAMCFEAKRQGDRWQVLFD